MNVDIALVEKLRDIAEEAGHAIMALYELSSEWQEKDDASPLTEADLRADAIIRTRLSADFPNVFVMSEESRTPGECTSDYFFLVDPLDGTKEFIKRNGEFTVNIALVYAGTPVAGVVLAPALHTCYYACAGLGAWMACGGEVRQLQVKQWKPNQPLRVIGSRSHASSELDVWLKQLRYDHSFVAAGSSLKFCRLAEGAADVYPRLAPTSQWDTAAAQCVLEAAGGAVIDLGGASLEYGLNRPMLNSHFFALGCGSIRQII